MTIAEELVNIYKVLSIQNMPTLTLTSTVNISKANSMTMFGNINQQLNQYDEKWHGKNNI